MSDYHGMSFERYDFLMDETGPCVQLTEDEVKAGWHFCDEWDGLLVHPDSVEFQHCTCPHMTQFRTEERKKMWETMKQKRNEALDRLADLDQELGLL